MLKLLTILAITSVSLYANSEEEKILNFFKEAVSSSKQYTLENITIVNKQDLEEVKDFRAYSVKIDLKLEGKDKKITLNDIVFTNGVVFTKDFLYLDSRNSIKDNLSPDVDNSFYDKSHLIEGSLNAKNKLLVFSDPLCPSCMDLIPDLIQFVRANEKDFALFYYSFPLSSHVGSKTLVKASIVAKKSNKDLLINMYNEAFDLEKTDEPSVLETFNKAMKTNLSLEDINRQEIVEMMENDIKKARNLMIKGTPTLYVNGKKDLTKKIYKTMVK
jgi:protein-disulfide isomerase